MLKYWQGQTFTFNIHKVSLEFILSNVLWIAHQFAKASFCFFPPKDNDFRYQLICMFSSQKIFQDSNTGN